MSQRVGGFFPYQHQLPDLVAMDLASLSTDFQRAAAETKSRMTYKELADRSIKINRAASRCIIPFIAQIILFICFHRRRTNSRHPDVYTVRLFTSILKLDRNSCIHFHSNNDKHFILSRFESVPRTNSFFFIF